MKCTLTVEITVEIHPDVDPHEVTFRGIENAVPQANGEDVGAVISYTTQEYFE